MSVNCDYYDKFDVINDTYLPMRGEGETVATQICTAVNKLVYKWYNDGDVFDNQYYLEGWANDLSSYANWLHRYIEQSRSILEGIKYCRNNSDYEDLLQELTDTLFDESYLESKNSESKVGSVYECDGPFKFVEVTDEDEDYDWWESEDDYDEEEEEEDFE